MNITPKEFELKIDQQIREMSGLEAHRSYLGISQIVKCPRAAYDAFVSGADLSDGYHHRMCYAGYMHEADVLRRLAALKLAKPEHCEVIAPVDGRIRGHIDGLTSWGDLLEVKSVTASKYSLVNAEARALHEHYDQVQLYMRYGHWQFAWIIYVCRETLEHRVIRVRYNAKRAAELERKGLRVLAAIDAGLQPACECGYCEKRG